MTTRSRFSGLLLRALGRPVAFAAAHMARLSGTRAGMAFVYHAVGRSTGDPRRELVPPHGAALFEAQVRHLRHAYRVVPASELPAAVAARKRWQRIPVSITFDDDLAAHLELAAPALARVGVPATFYVCGGSLEQPFSYWWQRLQVAHDRGVRVPVPAHAGVEEDAGIWPLAMAIEGLEPAARDEVADGLRAALGPDPPDAGMREADVRALAQAGFEIGFHTLRHDCLPQLDDTALDEALRVGRARLESVTGRPTTTIAYPHGKADERVARAAREAGFQTGFTTRATRFTTGDDQFLIGRLEPSFASAGHFALAAIRMLVRRDPKDAR